MRDIKDFLGWEMIDWFDLQPFPGSFVSPTYDDYEVHGETIHALNWLHAEYTWLNRHVEKSGDEPHRCCHCNHSIRYAVVFRDPAGFIHIVGQDCARFINSQLDYSKFTEKRLISEMKEIETKRGKRFVLSIGQVPSWYWDIPRDQRPSYVSMGSYEKMNHRRKTKVWTLSIWGESPAEIVAHVREFHRFPKQSTGV